MKGTATLHATKTCLDVSYMLRWRLEYASGKVCFGAWSDPGNCPSTSAYAQERNGIALAAVEAKDVRTKLNYTLATCLGSEYFKFQWEAVSPMPLGLVGQNNVKMYGKIHGLSLLTTNKKHTVWINGRIETKEFTGKEYNSWDGR